MKQLYLPLATHYKYIDRFVTDSKRHLEIRIRQVQYISSRHFLVSMVIDWLGIVLRLFRYFVLLVMTSSHTDKL